MPDDATADPTIGYAEALAELESIVAELEREAVDVDHLSERVQRAAQLVSLLRDRIGSARMDVTRVLADLEDLGGPTS
ncbi:MAG: exodeoxyribonuclease VII small subunit [Acidimicrobiales bacterium]